MSAQISSKVKLSLPILQEVNSFSRLNLSATRVDTITCFSDAVITAWVCEPQGNPAPEGKDPAKDYCHIHWACKTYLAGRLGVGLAPNEPYNFEKSKEFAKTLTYERLVEQIKSKLDGKFAPPPSEALKASVIEETKKEQSNIKPEEAPVKPVVAKTPKGSMVSNKTSGPPIASGELPPVAKADKPKSVVQAIHGYNPGVLGHFLLSSIPITPETITKDALWTLALEKKFNSTGRFDLLLTKLQTEGLVQTAEGTLSRVK